MTVVMGNNVVAYKYAGSIVYFVVCEPDVASAHSACNIGKELSDICVDKRGVICAVAGQWKRVEVDGEIENSHGFSMRCCVIG